MSWRWAMLGLGLVATLLAAFRVSQTGDDLVAPIRRPGASHGAQPGGPAPTAAKSDSASGSGGVIAIRPRDQDEGVANVFARAAWLPPAAPSQPVGARPPAAAPLLEVPLTEPPPPEAPPLPFHVLGRYVEDGKVAVFLQHNDQNLVVRVGETIADQYKVESLAGGVLTLVYLPLNQRQTLEVGNPL
jgi:hypothetical protein